MCTAEGAAAEVVGACCGGAILIGWALHLGMSVVLIGLLGALPVVAQVLHIPGAVLTARFGHRRTALAAIAISRQAFLPLAFSPWLPLGPDGQRVLLVVAAGTHHGLGIIANNAWCAWMGELVPASLRGRYFGPRTAYCTLVGGVCALVAGVGLDAGRRVGVMGPVLQGLAVGASVSGAVSVVLMARQHANRPPPVGIRRSLRAMAGPALDARARRVVAYAVAWNAACGLSAPFFSLYLLRDLRSGYAVLAAQGAGLAAAKVATARLWGRVLDRMGPRHVLVACTAGLALSPLAWIACAPGRLWPLVVETAIGGVFLGGHAVASFALPLSVGPARERPFYLAAFAVAGGVAFAVTSAAGGALLAARGEAASLELLLAGSAFLRIVAVGAAVALAPRDVPARLERSLPVQAVNDATARAA